jgi:hypothetical protein
MNNTEPFSCKWRGCGLLWHRKTRQIRIEMLVQRTRTTNAALTCSFRQPLRQRASSKSLSISHDTFGSAPTSAPAVTAQALTWRASLTDKLRQLVIDAATRSALDNFAPRAYRLADVEALRGFARLSEFFLFLGQQLE